VGGRRDKKANWPTFLIGREMTLRNRLIIKLFAKKSGNRLAFL
jgi:hypothetical protein